MRKILLAVLVITGLQVFAGVPGYQGKRFSIIYDIGINHPAIVAEPGVLPMLFHNLTADYVLTRGLSIGFKYGFMFYNTPVTDYSGGADLSGYKSKYTQHTFAVIVKKFYRKKGYIAPVGRFFHLAYIINMVQ